MNKTKIDRVEPKITRLVNYLEKTLPDYAVTIAIAKPEIPDPGSKIVLSDNYVLTNGNIIGGLTNAALVLAWTAANIAECDISYKTIYNIFTTAFFAYLHAYTSDDDHLIQTREQISYVVSRLGREVTENGFPDYSENP